MTDNDVVAKVKSRLMEKLEFMEDVDDMELQNMISEEIRVINQEEHIPINKRIQIGKKIFDSMRKLDLLQEFIEDTSVTEIMINGPSCVFVERKGRLYKVKQCFDSEDTLRNVIAQIVAKCNRVVNDSSPIVDARLMDGSRVNVVLNPVAINGPILTIRRFPEKPYLMEDLIRIGSLSEEAALFLKNLVVAGYNIIVSGANRIIGLSQMTFRKQRVQTT